MNTEDIKKNFVTWKVAVSYLYAHWTAVVETIGENLDDFGKDLPQQNRSKKNRMVL